MGILEQVIKMRGQGIPEREIFNELSQNGIPPRAINDALKQAQIKYAVSNTGEGSDELQPSIMLEGEATPAPAPESSNGSDIYQPGSYESSPRQEYPPQQEYAQPPQEEYASPQDYQQQEAYQQPEQQYYAPGTGYEQYSAGINADTVMEVADQVFSDKIKKFQKQLDAASEAAIVLQTRTENILERLKKIETIMDKLQIAILEKVGSYGQNLESIRKEMSMMQDSFSKMISHPREQKETQKKHTK